MANLVETLRLDLKERIGVDKLMRDVVEHGGCDENFFRGVAISVSAIEVQCVGRTGGSGGVSTSCYQVRFGPGPKGSGVGDGMLSLKRRASSRKNSAEKKRKL
jgi:hypothetical protein